MPKPLLRLGQYLLIVAMFAACGGHWVVLRSVAWSTMVMEYSHTATWAVALEKTFNGRNPCDLCKRIEKGQGEEQKPGAQLVAVKKFHLYLAEAPVIWVLQPEGVRQSTLDCHEAARSDRPPVPPPRVA